MESAPRGITTHLNSPRARPSTERFPNLKNWALAFCQAFSRPSNA